MKCFRDDGREISREDVNRVNEPLIITSINTDCKSFSVHKSPEKWNNGNDSGSNIYQKLIGIYIDDNINKLPDYLIPSPAYINIEGNSIILNNEITKEIFNKIIPYTTKVMNHNSGNFCSYDYSVICGENIPNQWKEYSCVYSGFSKGFGDIKGKFRPETREIKPFIHCNYEQNEDAVLEIKNIELNIKEKPKF